MLRARPRARRSRYNVTYRLTRSVPALIVAALLAVVLVGATLTYQRLDDFFTATTGHHLNPLGEVVQAIEPSPGTIAYKLKHGQRVNILLLGRGGYENDAPFLTDSIMAVSIDPASNRVMMLSIPRDLVVKMNLQDPSTRTWANLTILPRRRYLTSSTKQNRPKITEGSGARNASPARRKEAPYLLTRLTASRIFNSRRPSHNPSRRVRPAGDSRASDCFRTSN
jgi:hypothetical protein